MQDPEQIRRFTRGMAMMKDPPWLPIAVWMAVVPALVEFHLLARPWYWYSLAVAIVAAVLASRRFKRTYGVVTPSPDSSGGGWMFRAPGGLAALAAFVSLQLVAVAIRLPVELGLVAFGGWLAWGARASEGLRRHLYVFAAICFGLAFIPLIAILAGHRSLPNYLLGSIFMSAWGAGWTYVCVQDYRVIRRNLRQAQG